MCNVWLLFIQWDHHYNHNVGYLRKRVVEIMIIISAFTHVPVAG